VVSTPPIVVSTRRDFNRFDHVKGAVDSAEKCKVSRLMSSQNCQQLLLYLDPKARIDYIYS